jgi:hypothetical protein
MGLIKNIPQQSWKGPLILSGSAAQAAVTTAKDGCPASSSPGTFVLTLTFTLPAIDVVTTGDSPQNGLHNWRHEGSAVIHDHVRGP